MFGRFEQAKSDILQSAIRLKSARSAQAISTKYLGDAELGLGHFDAAIEDYHKAIDLACRIICGPTQVWPPQMRSRARWTIAKSALGEVRRLEPKLTMKWLIPRAPPIPNLFDGLRKAGMPEEMSETRKLAAILVADVVGYSRLAGADEDRTLARLRGLRSDLIDPTIAVHHGRIVKRTGDGSLIEFRSVVDAVRCAIEVQNRHGRAQCRLAARAPHRVSRRHSPRRRRRGGDGDLMGDGVNIAARLEGIAKPGAICLSEDAYRQVKGRLDLAVSDLGPTQLKNIAEPIRVYSLEVGKPDAGEARAGPQRRKNPPGRGSRWSSCRLPISAATRSRSISSTGSRRA